MKINELLEEILSEKKYNFSKFNISCIIEDVTGAEPPFSLCVENVKPEHEKKIRELSKRLSEGEPLQYLLGKWEFYGLPFYVGEGVLIPRGDTELLVEKALQILEGANNPKIADLCAGSGCIGIAIGKNLETCSIKEVELYQKAYDYLIKNIELNEIGHKVEAIRADVLKPLPFKDLDLIVSNPPYIREDEMEGLDIEVKKEPLTALVAPERGLLFYRELSKRGMESLKKGGLLLVETGYEQREDVERIFKEGGFLDIESFNDLAGNHRAVMGRKPL